MSSNYELSSEELTIIHAQETELLKLFDAFCQTNHLAYTIYGGTMLGAIRHKGFIPWDNDIDVLMPRRDYQKFIKSFPTKDITICCYPIFKKYRFFWTQLRKPGFRDDVWLDVFAADFENQMTTIQKKGKKLDIWKGVFKRKMTPWGGPLDKRENRGWKTFLSKLLPVWLIRRVCENQSSQLVSGQYLVDYQSACGFEKSIFSPDMCTNTMRIPFEQITVNCCKNYDKVLSQTYGHYLELPPVEQRKATHETGYLY